MVLNYFDFKEVAERYAKGRPQFHHITIARIQKHLNLQQKLTSVLDIACGTGLSTVALLEIADKVYATDSSKEMIQQALTHDKIKYEVSPAEKQSFPDQTFNLITVCSGVHWFYIENFLTESNRLLKHSGWLVLYDNFFLSEMSGVSSFCRWYPDVYLKKFPAPQRNNSYNWSHDNLVAHNFVLDGQEEFKNKIRFTKETLVLYFTTQSNITSVVENGQMTYQQVEYWLNEELVTFFPDEQERELNFGNWIKYLRKNN